MAHQGFVRWVERQSREACSKALQEGHQKGLQIGLQEGRQEGLQEGRLEGRQDGIQETSVKIITTMFKKGFTVNEILSATELPEDLVRRTVQDIQS